MPPFVDYYRILGVHRQTEPEVVVAAYRALARHYHPDLNAGDLLAEDRLRQINEAYEVLSDFERRRTYNREWDTHTSRRATSSKRSSTPSQKASSPASSLAIDLTRKLPSLGKLLVLLMLGVAAYTLVEALAPPTSAMRWRALITLVLIVATVVVVRRRGASWLRTIAAGIGAWLASGVLSTLAVLLLALIVSMARTHLTNSGRASSTDLNSRTYEIHARDTYFDPKTLTIPADSGAVIDLSNQGRAFHNFTVVGTSISVDLPPGGARQVAWFHPRPGTYQFYCDVPGHKQAGMVGTLTVK